MVTPDISEIEATAPSLPELLVVPPEPPGEAGVPPGAIYLPPYLSTRGVFIVRGAWNTGQETQAKIVT